MPVSIGYYEIYDVFCSGTICEYVVDFLIFSLLYDTLNAFDRL